MVLKYNGVILGLVSYYFCTGNKEKFQFTQQLLKRNFVKIIVNKLR